MGENKCVTVPLAEQLRSVPRDAKLQIDTPNALGCMDTRSIPVGRFCHEAANMAQWTAVTDRMPDPGTECIVWSPGNAQHGPYAYLDTWQEQYDAPVSFSSATIPVGLGWDSSAFDEITHWMPMPLPPAPQGVRE